VLNSVTMFGNAEVVGITIQHLMSTHHNADTFGFKNY
jgi:hypothetical protein